MSFFEIFLIGIGLSMDAFAVSLTNGMFYRDLKYKGALFIGLAFGLFQGIMPLAGYFAGSLFTEKISAVDHWIALILLGIIGGNMIKEGFTKENDNEPDSFPKSEKKGNHFLMIASGFAFQTLLIQAVATSIDALAVGVSFAALNINIFYAISIIAITTFFLSIAAVFIGKSFGNALNQKSQLVGGLILVLIGLKIFIQHQLPI